MRKGKTKKIKKLRAFTLVEVLIVIGILAILLSITLIAINPSEQINESKDVATQAVAQDFVYATKYYSISENTLPWEKDTSCRQELANNEILSDMPSCLNDLTSGGQLQTSVLSSDEAKSIYVTECNDAIAVCYNPKSQKFNQNNTVSYTKNGAPEPTCPSKNGNPQDCYSCTFSTSDAQQCFQALNPHGTLAVVPSLSPSQLLPIQSRNTKNACNTATPGNASCMAKVVTDSSGNPLSSIALPAGFGPAQIHTAYNLPCTPGGAAQTVCNTPSNFGPQMIAVVDAYQDPTLESDLAVYDQAYGLPDCTIANGCLTIVNQNGQTSPLPAVDANWALEESLDIQMSHAVCQTCKIMLVEANIPSYQDIGVAENTAAQMGATAISNSYGASEFSWETSFDSYYNHPGIFITASSGDWGYGSYYPAASNHVIAVGGTTLWLYADNSYSSESTWSLTGSGCSAYEFADSFQTSLSNWNLTGCGNKRGITDVSAVADPNTGVAVYDSTEYSGNNGWWILGGTSVSSPIVSAALTLIGNAPSNQDSGSLLYNNPSLFRDVTSGVDGSCGGSIMCSAGIGYDGPTGLGSPNLININLITPLPTAIPSPTPTPTPTPPPTQTQVWVAGTYNNYDGMYIFNTNGTFVAGPLEGKANGVYGPNGVTKVGTQVWVVYQSSNKILRFNTNGTVAASPLTSNGLVNPQDIAVVGSQVWITNNSNNNSISRFNIDGTSAGSPITGNGVLYPCGLVVVGSQVWVVNNQPLMGNSNISISRFNFDGTSAGSILTGNGLYQSTGIAVVGNQVWVTNNKTNNNSISRFNFDGTSAGSPLTGNGLSTPDSLAVVGNQVWVTSMRFNSFARFNFDGSSAGSPLIWNNLDNDMNIAAVQ
jgi:prepilin-type N-terminal cleavage/methylation domain-containing protein